MAKIAVELEEAVRQRTIAGEAGNASASQLAKGSGWSVDDVICTSGPDDRPFEEQHAHVSMAIVTGGTFQYRASSGHALMVPGAILLGHPGQTFECAHDHGSGDRCLSFHFTPELFERIARSDPRFNTQRLPPLRASASLVARACAAMDGASNETWEELAIEIAATAAHLANDLDVDTAAASSSAISRVTRVIRSMEQSGEAAAVPLQTLADETRLSPYHFLRTFTRIAGVTPHQFALRSRLREAALRLALDDQKVIDIALDCGFGDVSNFNRTFRAEFGSSPRAYRRARRLSSAAR